jgi:hypothetical protein
MRLGQLEPRPRKLVFGRKGFCNALVELAALGAGLTTPPLT